MKKLASITLTAALVFGAVSCASGVQKDATYASVSDLAKAYEASGATKDECENEPTQDMMDKSGWQATTCGMNTVMTIADSDSKFEELMAKNIPYMSDRDRALVGKRWMIRAPQADIEKLQESLGGKIYSSTDL